MRKHILVIVWLLATGFLYCDSLSVVQNPKLTNYNNIYLNLFGDGSIASVNYERIFKNTPKLFHTFKLGVSYHPDIGTTQDAEYEGVGYESTDKSGLIITNHLTFNYGKKFTFFEVGLGTSAYLIEENEEFLIYPIIGLRRQSNNGSIRIFVHPIFLNKDNVELVFPIGFSFGICF